MGRRHDIREYRRYNPEVEEGYDSHVSSNKLEYVVFNGAQLLPLYVLHLAPATKQHALELAIESNNGLNGIRLLPEVMAKLRSAMTEEEQQEVDLYARQSMTEHARKYLPDGFGAASGNKFVVEDVAPLDDDEELWGACHEQDPEWDRTIRDMMGVFQGEYQGERTRQFWDDLDLDVSAGA
jgi:hypothetical protein